MKRCCDLLNKWLLLGLLALGMALHGAKAAEAPMEAPAKFALLIGNGNYNAGNLSLRNPENDTRLLAQSLTRLGFTVKQAFNLSRTQMFAAVSDYSTKLPAGSTSLVFYAGHGMQIGGASYLLPTDMTITTEQSVPLRAYPVKNLLESVAASQAAVNVLVLDACRDNPFQPAPAVRYRGINSLGLGTVVAPRGTFIAYSTSPGQLAPDGTADNSVYASTLARVILQPRLSLVEIFRRVGDQVRKSTLDDQIPWFESSLNEEYYFQPPDGVKVASGVPLRTNNGQGSGNGIMRGAGDAASSTPAWYRTMSEYEWSDLDYEIQQRVKSMTPDELPMMEHRAEGGSVVAQTTLGLFWLEGANPINTVGNTTVSRYGANNTKGMHWLRMAADAGFPIAQAELGERLYQGRSADRDMAQAQRLLTSAAEAKYPRAKLDLLQVKMQSGNVSGEDAQEVLRAMINSFNLKQ